ncbi:hypothetical protein MIR68_000968 [Amoeboaphelidium protococcarum]|nr:hypothetical protein MIR68_000968 [Amoeboaphelidium protococcarum]
MDSRLVKLRYVPKNLCTFVEIDRLRGFSGRQLIELVYNILLRQDVTPPDTGNDACLISDQDALFHQSKTELNEIFHRQQYVDRNYLLQDSLTMEVMDGRVDNADHFLHIVLDASQLAANFPEILLHDASNMVYCRRVYYEGFLMKKGFKSLQWKKRYVILREHRLSYYGSQHDYYAPLGTIDLSQDGVAVNFKSYQSLSFYIRTSEKCYKFKAYSVFEFEQWRQTLESIKAGTSQLVIDACTDFKDSGDVGDCSSDTLPMDMADCVHERDLFNYTSDQNNDNDSINDAAFDHLDLDIALGSIDQRSRQYSCLNSPDQNFNKIYGDFVGLLYKKGHGNSLMSTRLCVINHQVMWYFKPRPDGDSGGNYLKNANYCLAGWINLHGSQVYGELRQHAEFNVKSCILRIRTAGRNYVFSTPLESDFNDWVSALELYSGVAVRMIRCESDLETAKSSLTEKDLIDAAFLSSPPSTEGVMLKQGNDSTLKFRERYCKLFGDSLYYFDESRLKLLGSIPLSCCLLEPAQQSAVVGDNYALQFNIILINQQLTNPIARRYQFQCLDRQQLMRWLSALSPLCTASPIPLI